MFIAFFATTSALCLFIILFSLRRMKTSITFKSNSSNNRNDDEGGLPTENLPLIDIPPSCELEDMLVDRWYDDVPTSRKPR